MKRMLELLAAFEWLLLIAGVLMISMMVIPFSDMYDSRGIVKDAKNKAYTMKAPRRNKHTSDAA